MTDLSYIERKVREFCDDSDVNTLISSEKYFDGVCILGIDEAGRGPVLGPMVYAGAYIELDHQERLTSIGLDDSKKLKESTREDLLVTLSDYKNKICGYEVEIISPHVISTQMLNTFKTSLNILSHNAAIDIIKRVLDKGVNLQEVYIDTVGPPGKYKALIESNFPLLKVVVESKADSKFPIVSAASIFAKVTRDRCIVNWKHKENIKDDAKNCGSGYPSDPSTKEYLKTVIDPIFGFPHFVRASWSTASVIVDKECVEVKWEDDDINESKLAKSSKRSHGGVLMEKSTQSLLNYYSPEVSLDKRNKFFTSRKLERVLTFM